ncbi:hypothetical protein VTN77DRAFT_6774 [Rasamsonia byssochlamydoides]|uniref:uncharacterized protein n=1 Tax=Rasamsonia byssochlamydoides TaxID=89139 RepID=UPI0037435F47
MTTVDDTLADLERQRLELEENVRKLQQSLYHWRLWEAEYDGLKEEIASLKKNSTKDDILKKGREFAGTVVDEKEVKALIGEGQGLTRSRDQVVQLISRRLDYVKQNVSTMEKRLAAAEGKLDSLLSIERPAVTAINDKEFPVTEIFEELDEDGNVISGRTTTPGERAPELLEVLKKVGVDDIPDRIAKKRLEAAKSEEEKDLSEEEEALEEKAREEKAREEKVPEEKVPEEKVPEEKVPEEKVPEEKVSEEKALEEKAPKEEAPKEEAPKEEAPEELKQQPQESVTEQREAFEKPTSTNGERPTKPTIEEEPDEVEQPVSDVDESPEDAKLRREMLQYGFHEVGAVVAELEMDEEGSEFSVEDDYEEEYDDDEDEEEDEYGRSTRSILTEEYHQQMRELEKKLNARGMLNIGRDTSVLPEEVRRELEEPRVVKVEKEQKESPSQPEEKKKKKKVAFAPELDIAPDPKPPAPEKVERTTRRERPEITAVADSIVERTTSGKGDNPSEETAAPPKKVSRFKMARSTGEAPADSSPLGLTTQAAGAKKQPSAPPPPTSLPLFPAKPKEPKPFSQPIIDRDIVDAPPPPRSKPRPPEGKTLADKLVEREVSDNVKPPEPDEFDEELHRKEIATEFYKMRNRMVQRKGGFVNDDEQEIVPLDEEPSDGQPKKRVSRFKAARMR